jgi:hypothetical protein
VSSPIHLDVLPAVKPGPARRRGRTVALIVVSVMALLAAASLAGVWLLRPAGLDAVAKRERPPVVTVPSTMAKPPSTKFTGDLRTLLLAKPAGAKSIEADQGSPDGTLTIDQLAQTYGNPAAAATWLKRVGYQRGIIRGWEERRGYQVFDAIYQFDTEGHCLTWMTDVAASYTEREELESTGNLENIYAGRYYVDKKLLNQRLRLTYAVLYRGAIAVALYIYTPINADLEYVKKLAQDQFDRLP